MDRSEILQKWMEENERGVTWVAQKIGYARVYVSNVVYGHRSFSDKLAQVLTEQLGIQFQDSTKGKGKRTSKKKAAT